MPKKVCLARFDRNPLYPQKPLRRTSMRKISTFSAVLILLVIASTWVSAQVMLDDFTGYTTGTTLATQGGWTKGGTGPDDSVANATPLTYTGYPSGGGNYVVMPTPTSTSSRVYKTWGADTVANYNNSTFYYSLLLNISSTSASSTNYFMSLGGAGSSNKLWRKTIRSNKWFWIQHRVVENI